jgi:PhnB protein
MAAKVKAVPRGYHTITPYLSIKGAADAIEFYKRAFGAKEVMRLAPPDGRVGHAELQLGDSRVMLADEFPDMDFRSPHAIGGTPVTIHMYVKDVDAVVKEAVAAGATITRPVEDQFYGDRSGTVMDPYGHVWHVSTHKEDLSEEEIRRRGDDAVAAGQPPAAHGGLATVLSRPVERHEGRWTTRRRGLHHERLASPPRTSSSW